MKIEGGCHCGYITYEATIDSEQIGICHCTDCQTLSGSAFRTGAIALKDNFRLLTGQPKIYVKTAQSGAKRAQAFCPECGTPIYAVAVSDPQVFSIRTGMARQTGRAYSKSPDLVPIRASLGSGHRADKAISRATADAALNGATAWFV